MQAEITNTEKSAMLNFIKVATGDKVIYYQQVKVGKQKAISVVVQPEIYIEWLEKCIGQKSFFLTDDGFSCNVKLI
jgi:hypothetical protein